MKHQNLNGSSSKGPFKSKRPISTRGAQIL